MAKKKRKSHLHQLQQLKQLKAEEECEQPLESNFKKHTQKESQKSITMKRKKNKKKYRTCECENGTKLNQEKVSEVKIRLKPMSSANNTCIINVKD